MNDFQTQQAKRRGARDGCRDGWNEGYHLGQAEAWGKWQTRQIPRKRNLRILYVTSGKQYPFSPIDEAILEVLPALSTEVQPITPDADALTAAFRFGPDLVLALQGMEFPVPTVQLLRMNGFRTAVWFTDDPYYSDMTSGIAAHYDDVFTPEWNMVEFYRETGSRRVHYLPLGANPRISRYRQTGLDYRKDVCFIGTAFWNRVDLFDRILPSLKRKEWFISGWWWTRLAQYMRLKDNIRSEKWMSPLKTAKYYAGSKMVLNVHRAHEDPTFNQNSRNIAALSVNPRTFEINACGSLQLTDERAELSKFYMPGREIVTYASPQDLLDKIDYYLAHERERRKIALRGLRRTLLEHTYTKRLEALLDIVLTTG